MTEIWTFKTRHFEVFCAAEPEDDADLSWADEDTLARIADGTYSNICWHVGVRLFDSQGNCEIGSAYLGNSVYEHADDFVREHRGTRAAEREYFEQTGVRVGMSSYFPGMVREAVKEARRFVRQQRAHWIDAMPRVRGDA